ncbi:MAG TPA: alpha/beta hydrolase [Acidimicrobiales bacterium]|nr:alpha/beta hydrolase [Acidimicrobiales bacterium]
MNRLAESWRARGGVRVLDGRDIFVVDIPARRPTDRPPLLVLHGFPTSSFDFHRVVDRLAETRPVVLFDMLGYGLSAKPDLAYDMGLQADLAVALVDSLGWDRLGLLTHDVGDTVGGELLARQLEGRWDVEVADRTLTNGSIYIGLAHLSAGQLFLLDLPDERLGVEDAPGQATVTGGIAATLSPATPSDEEEATAQWQMIAHHDGHRLLPRLIRYIEERRRHESRFTGAIEDHPSPLAVVWGRDDPIADVAMTERLRSARPDIRLEVLGGVGHYPMVEAPDRFVEAVLASG